MTGPDEAGGSSVEHSHPRVIMFGAGALTVLILLWALETPQVFDLAFYNEQFLAIVFGGALALVFLTIPARRGAKPQIRLYDWLAAAVAITTFIHIAVSYRRLAFDVSIGTTETVVIGAIVVCLTLEGLRRAAGTTLLVVVLVFIGYALVADLVPGDLEGRPVAPSRLVTYLSLDTNALLGAPLKVGATVVILFILMGQLLFAAGGGAFFTDLALAAMGGRRGGAAKIAVFASALFGSISGTAVSNVASTGVLTIPLMRRSGYRAIDAAAIEAVASTGGQLMPPIMGAAAFLMAEILQIPYSTVVFAAVLPSLLYYFAVFVQIDLVAARDKIAFVDIDIVSTSTVMRAGWHFLLPIAVLVYALFVLLAEPEVSALYACAAILVMGLLRGYRDNRLTLRTALATLSSTGLIMIELFMILGAAGFVIGVMNVTGLGFALTSFLVNTAGGNIAILLLISAAVCIVLGMGMPTLGVYILLAALVAPAIVEGGVAPLSAHFFILYFGMMSMITPPIALAAFAAAAIAGSEPMATGWASMRFAWVAYFIPFAFVAAPALLMQDSRLLIAINFATALAGVYFATVAVVGHLFRPINAASRVALGLAGLTSLTPWPSEFGLLAGINIAALSIGALVIFGERAASRGDVGDPTG